MASTTRGAFDKLAESLRYVDGDYAQARKTYDAIAKSRSGRWAPSGRPTTSPFPPSLFPIVVEAPRASPAQREGRPRDRREAVRARPCVGPGAQPGAPLGLPRVSRSSASTTTSARSRSRTSSTSASPTRSSSRSGTATTSRACRSRWPRTSASQGRGSFYEEVGALRDVVQNHLLQIAALLAMEPPVGEDDEPLRDEKEKVFAAMRHARDRPTSCAGSSPATATRTASRPTPTSRRSPPCACSSTRGAGRACRSTSGPARSCRSPRPRSSPSCAGRRSRCSRKRQSTPTTRTTCASGSGPTRWRSRWAAATSSPGESFVGTPVELYRVQPGPRRDVALRAPPRRRDGGRGSAVRARGRRRSCVAVVDPVLTDHGPAHPYKPKTWGPAEANALLPEGEFWHAPEP